MKKNLKKINLDLPILLFLIFLGFYFRYLNLFFEDYWIDEMALFWEADPNVALSETLDRIQVLDTSPALFVLLSKYFFKFFQYHPDAGRFFVLIIGTAAIPLAFLIPRELKLKKSSVLFSFFICSNIYLINYSQEVRTYSLLFLISLLNIFLFLKVINEFKNKKRFYIFCCFLFIVNILGFSTHPFFLIIVVSEISYCLIKIILKEKKFFKVFLISVFSLIFSILVEYDYLLSLKADENVNWIQSSDYLNAKFFTDFYFRKFFGSKIMGAIYFFTLASLIFNLRKKIFFSSHYLIFILIIFFSYFIPILYGFVKLPVLYDRYIIFVLIPIFTLISALIYELKNVKIKMIIISILVITTLSNLYLEIANKNYHHKPETKKLLNSISALHDEQYSKNIYIDEKNGVPTFFNYVVNLDEFYENDLKMLKLNQLSSADNFWLICYVDIYVNGVWYKDLPDGSNSSCPRAETGINKKFKIIKIIKKNNPFHKVIAKYYTK